jgi:amidase
MLSAMSGRDAADPASAAVGERFDSDYARYVDPKGLRGARLGIARKFFADSTPLNGFLDVCVAALRSAGAIIVDPADLPMHGSFGAAEQEVLLYEFKTDLNSYLRRFASMRRTRIARCRCSTKNCCCSRRPRAR